MRIRDLTESDHAWVRSLVSEHFGSVEVVSRGVVHDSGRLPGLVAERDSGPAGLLQYRVDRDQWEIVLLISIDRRQGVGRQLLASVQQMAVMAGCRRLWLVTTNNNRAAIAFYRALGWRQAETHRGAVQAARALKPEIPEFDAEGTPIEDEIEFELQL